MSHWMFNCKDVSQRVSESMDRSLPLHHRMMIKIHLMMCKYCARFKQQLLALRNACRLDDLHGEDCEHIHDLPQAVRGRLKLSLSRHMAEQK
jgi:hypothetical protein